MGKTMSEHDFLLIVLKRYLKLKTDEDLAELLGYRNASSISRIRRGDNSIPDGKLDVIAEKCGVTRADIAQGWKHVAKLLGVENDLPSTMSPARMPLSTHDSAIIKSLSGDYTLLHVGRDLLTSETLCVVSQWIRFDQSTDKSSRIKELEFKNHYALGGDLLGEANVYAGTVHISCDYGVDYPPTNLILRPLIITEQVKALSGLCLDITEEASPRIFSAQCLLFNNSSAKTFPQVVTPRDEHYHALYKFLKNEISPRGALIGKYGDTASDEARALVTLAQKVAAAASSASTV